MKKLLTTALVTGVLATAASVAAAGEIAVIVKTTNSSFWQNVNKGASAAIEGISEHTMTFNGPASESAIADQVALVENAINRGVAAIVLAPSDPEALSFGVRLKPVFLLQSSTVAWPKAASNTSKRSCPQTTALLVSKLHR